MKTELFQGHPTPVRFIRQIEDTDQGQVFIYNDATDGYSFHLASKMGSMTVKVLP